METAIWVTCSMMGLGMREGYAIASTQPRCGLFLSRSWRAKATASIAGFSSMNLRNRSRHMSSTQERAILAGGCFWGMQDLFRRYPGVVSTRVGYSGGDVPNATYRNHGTHAEAIEINFDPAKIGYRDLLEFFFQIHDPS